MDIVHPCFWSRQPTSGHGHARFEATGETARRWTASSALLFSFISRLFLTALGTAIGFAGLVGDWAWAIYPTIFLPLCPF